jgi:Protein kinase domain
MSTDAVTSGDAATSTDAPTSIGSTLFILPPDAKFLPVAELAARLRARIGPVDAGQSVITRPGFRVTTRLVPGPLADLITEFREPSLITDAIVRFARAHKQDPAEMLELAFDALATLVEARILVPAESPDASAPEPSLAAGQAFAQLEIQTLVRSLEDSEVYRAQAPDGSSLALKIARADRPALVATFALEASVLETLAGIDSPAFHAHGIEGGRAYIAMEWCDGVSIAVAAQHARATRDRRRVHELVSRLLDAYGRLHARGVLHGDIHPGNCLVRDDGRVVILDFGNARPIEPVEETDPLRAGIPQFHDPQLAEAVLAGRMSPSATAASEQYAIAVLAYLLLTGQQPIDSPAVRDELLTRIMRRPAAPFASRGIAAWPAVEAVLARALAKAPADRFPNVSVMSKAFASAESLPDVPAAWHANAARALDVALASVHGLAPSDDPLEHAWFALRAALAFEDAELLGAADIIASRAGAGWAAHACLALVARARSDVRKETRAIDGFLAAAQQLRDGPEVAAAIMAAARILDGAMSRSPSAAALADWAAQRLNRLVLAAASNDAVARRVPASLRASVALMLGKTGAVAIHADLTAWLELLLAGGDGDLWLWAAAYDMFGDARFKARALATTRPGNALRRGFALLRLHQLTGDVRWITDARRVVSRAPSVRLPALQTALLMTELMAPEQAMLPPSLFLRVRERGRSGISAHAFVRA